MKKEYTPENIIELKENEVFVFGSNMNGNHAGGAAYLAVQKFGAEMGNPEGIQGQSYAIPTLDKEMERINLTALEKSIRRFYEYADKHPENTFYMTKIGCGIAGHELSDIATVVNCRDIPENVIIPEEFTHIPGFKGFNENMQCRGFQYEVGKDYHEDGNIQACESGLHYCKYPLDVFGYYPPANSRFCEVEGSGSISNDSGDTKIAVSDLKIKAEIGIAGIVKAAIEYTKKRCTNKHNAEEGKAATAGDSGAATSRGASSVGENGLAVARGNGVKVKGGMGAILVIAEEEEENFEIKSWKAVVVDGINVKPDTWYKIVDGKLEEV